MTNTNRKAQIKQRIAEIGEPWAEASRAIRESRDRQPRSDGAKVYIDYELTIFGTLEFDAGEWANAFSDGQRKLVEEAVAERLEDDFALFGGLGFAEAVDNSELEYTVTTQAEIEARYAEEVIEAASRAYAGIRDEEAWPDGVARPVVQDSHVAVHDGLDYVVLRRGRSVLAVLAINGGAFKVLPEWPKELERR